MTNWRLARFIGWAAILGLSVYGFLIEPASVEITYHHQPSKGLAIANYSWSKSANSDEAVPRFRVVQIADLHLHTIGRAEESVIEKVNALAPNLLLLTGDIVDRPAGLAVLDKFLQQLTAKGKYAVLGNWEYWGEVDLQELRKLYSRRGVTLLVNECVEYTNEGYVFQIAGLDDFTAGAPDESKIFEQCKDENAGRITAFYRGPSKGIAKGLILMQHSPGYFVGRKPLEERFHWLTLSGHTHGGQVSPFGIAFWTPTGSGPFFAGWYVTAYKDLYVSRGVGTSLVPFRLGARPEIAVFDIRQ